MAAATVLAPDVADAAAPRADPAYSPTAPDARPAAPVAEAAVAAPAAAAATTDPPIMARTPVAAAADITAAAGTFSAGYTEARFHRGAIPAKGAGAAMTVVSPRPSPGKLALRSLPLVTAPILSNAPAREYRGGEKKGRGCASPPRGASRKPIAQRFLRGNLRKIYPTLQIAGASNQGLLG